MNRVGPQSAPTQLNATSQGPYNLRKRPEPRVALEQTKTARPSTQTTPSKATPNSHSIIETNDGEVCAEYIQGLATCADRQAMSHNNYDAKLKLFALHQAKATAALSDLMPEIRACPPSSVLAELEDLKREMAIVHSKEKEQEATISRLKAENKKTEVELTVALNKEKELEATITGLTHKNKVFSAKCAAYVSQVAAMEAENKKIKEELTDARSKKMKLEATIAGLELKNKVFSAQHASYESRIIALVAEDKKTKEELMAARSKEKEQEATISRIMHNTKVFSSQCATYESPLVALEAENKKTKEELGVDDKNSCTRARAASYTEGVKEGKAKRLR